MPVFYWQPLRLTLLFFILNVVVQHFISETCSRARGGKWLLKIWYCKTASGIIETDTFLSNLRVLFLSCYTDILCKGTSGLSLLLDHGTMVKYQILCYIPVCSWHHQYHSYCKSLNSEKVGVISKAFSVALLLEIVDINSFSCLFYRK